ncbi:MAG: Trm112 family protein [Actinomycetota bacterium]
MALDADLLAILRCPADRGELDYLEEQARLVCATCGRRYEVLDGDIPNMLIEEAEQPS